MIIRIQRSQGAMLGKGADIAGHVALQSPNGSDDFMWGGHITYSEAGHAKALRKAPDHDHLIANFFKIEHAVNVKPIIDK